MSVRARARRLLGAVAVACLASFATPAQAGIVIIGLPFVGPSLTLRPAGSFVVGAPSVLATAPQGVVELEVVLDTWGASLEGYVYGVDWTGGEITELTLVRVESATPPLVPDLFGPYTVAGKGAMGGHLGGTELRNVNAASLTPGPGLAGGVYVLDRLSFEVGTLPEEGIEVVLVLGEGDVFGLAGAVDQPSRTYGVTLVPEPASALRHGAALLALVMLGRRRRRRPQPSRVDCS